MNRQVFSETGKEWKKMKKVVITQDLCRMVELMLKGGAQAKEISERMGISKATVSRIKTAGYSLEQYQKNTTERVEKENQAEEQKEQEPEQVPGQISMDLQPAEEPAAEMSNQVKMMRFQAAQVEKVLAKLDKINDNICQLLRRMDK